MNRKIVQLGAALSLSLGLAGCISLFPDSEPAQLYTFKGAIPAVTAQVATVSVQRGATIFTRPAAGDRILTRNGAEATYIGGARWAAPASTLFDEGLAAAFDSSPVRIAARGEPGLADAQLRVEVRTFEAQYRDGLERPPTVVVEARGTLLSQRERAVLGTMVFRAEQGAVDNRTGPIVEAFDAATGMVLQQMVGWTAETVKPAPPR